MLSADIRATFSVILRRATLSDILGATIIVIVSKATFSVTLSEAKDLLI